MRRLAIIGALCLTACATDPTHGLSNAELRERAADAGARPTVETAGPMMEAAVKARLKDPDSARFDWPYGFARSSIALSGKAPDGWFTCGSVNAKNGFGGYAGKAAVMVVISNGQIVFLDMDTGRYRPVANSCAKSAMPVL